MGGSHRTDIPKRARITLVVVCTCGTIVSWWAWKALWDRGEVEVIGATLTHTTAAVFGSSEPTGVDRHGAPFTGLHGRAVGWAVVRKWTELFGGVVGMGSLWTNVTFRTDLRFSSLRSTV